jgi:hypothetical protein
MPGAEWILAVYIGTAHTLSAPLLVMQPATGTALTLSDVDYDGRSFTPPLYYGYRLSVFPRAATFGVEAEFIHLKTYARTQRETNIVGVQNHRTVDRRGHVNDVVERLSISHGLNLILVNAAVRRTFAGQPGGAPSLQLTARIGAGPTVSHPESIVNGESHDGYELGAAALHAAAGIEHRISRRVAVMAEYKFTRSSQRISIARGTAESAFASHHVVAGVAWILRAPTVRARPRASLLSYSHDLQ